MTVNLIYMTAGSFEEAEKLGRELVTQNLAACVNIFDGMKSIYRWQGELQSDEEVVVIAKTTDDRAAELIDAVKAIHSYAVPCILQVPVAGGHQPFLDWITSEVKG